MTNRRISMLRLSRPQAARPVINSGSMCRVGCAGEADQHARCDRVKRYKPNSLHVVHHVRLPIPKRPARSATATSQASPRTGPASRPVRQRNPRFRPARMKRALGRAAVAPDRVPQPASTKPANCATAATPTWARASPRPLPTSTTRSAPN